MGAARELETSSGWWRHRRVLAYLDVDAKTLRDRMVRSPAHIARPWVNIGSARRPDYRWRVEGVDQWWVEVHEWRASREGTAGGAYAGEIPTVDPGHGSARPAGQPSSSRRRSRRAARSESDGSLVTFVKSRISEAC